MFRKKTFKFYNHWAVDCKPEVRRIDVEKLNITSFQELDAKLQHVFPVLKGKTYLVTWKDEEGDDITISSDEELSSVLYSLSPTNIIKLNIYVKETDEIDDNDIVIPAVRDYPNVGPTGLCHRGVKCDGCNSAVWGFRYKCSTCVDFDLCPKCEAAGMHSQHCMVRIPSPIMPHSMIKTAIKKSQNFLKSFEGDSDKKYCRTRDNVLDTLTTILSEITKLARDIEQKPERGGEKDNNKKNTNLDNFPFCNNKEKFNFSFGPRATGQFVNPPPARPLMSKSIFGPFRLDSDHNWNLQNKPLLFGKTEGFGSAQLPTGGLLGVSAPKGDPVFANLEPKSTVQAEHVAIPSVEPTTYHPKPHINEAIKQLLAMGFSNEGDCLTQLAECEDGNLAAIIEYLPPVNCPAQ